MSNHEVTFFVDELEVLIEKKVNFLQFSSPSLPYAFGVHVFKEEESYKILQCFVLKGELYEPCSLAPDAIRTVEKSLQWAIEDIYKERSRGRKRKRIF